METLVTSTIGVQDTILIVTAIFIGMAVLAYMLVWLENIPRGCFIFAVITLVIFEFAIIDIEKDGICEYSTKFVSEYKFEKSMLEAAMDAYSSSLIEIEYYNDKASELNGYLKQMVEYDGLFADKIDPTIYDLEPVKLIDDDFIELTIRGE